MSFFGDLWDDITGKTAAEEAQEAARKAQAEAETEAAQARTFAETEGQGTGSIGSIQLGIDEDVEDEEETLSTQLSI